MTKKSGVSIAALVLGILALIFCWVPFLGLILGIVAVILGLKGMKTDKENKGIAIAGLVLGIIAVVVGGIFSLILFIGGLAFFGTISPDEILPQQTTFSTPLPNADMAKVATNGDVSIYMKNNLGNPVVISSFVGTGNNDCVSTPALKVDAQSSGTIEVQTGEYFTLTFECGGEHEIGDYFQSELGFDYVDSVSETTQTHSGKILVKIS